MSRRRRRLKRERRLRADTNRSEGSLISLTNHPEFKLAAVVAPEFTKLAIETILRLDSQTKSIK